MLSRESAGDTAFQCTNHRPDVRDRASLAESYLGMLGGHVRLNLLRALAEQPGSVTDLSRRLRASVPLVSHNLRRMQEAGLVHGQSRGRQRIYSLDERVAVGTEGSLLVRVSLGEGWQIQVEAPILPPEQTFPATTSTARSASYAPATPLATRSGQARRLIDAAAPPGGLPPVSPQNTTLPR